ncbi:MAG: Uncharacterized protein XD63_1426 [Thermoanaerobacterales bacterium 50_218]|nr:MAG: Uncharacterized protein XD63_1426 [Thermoanaerobacterales bacterium 50_218]HAA89411.1 hypothetical protein [Peptococcaceae bacterium]
MNAKTTIILGLKVIILTSLLFVCYLIASMSVGLTDSAQTADRMGAMVTLLIVCALQTIVLSYPIVRSRWIGWRLILAIFFVFYGVMTFLSQIETVVFLKYLVDIVPTEMIPKLFLQGTIIAALFSPLAVLIHGRIKSAEELQEANQRLVMPWTEWVWKLILIAVIYVAIYFSFGMFVFRPLAGEAFQEYYAGLQLPGWILLFQMVRAMIWTALALPVIRMMKGRWWEAGLAVALLFSVLMGSLLLLPNPYMPDTIRMAHFVEVSSSNFLFGWIVVWLLNRRHGSLREMFQCSEGDHISVK